MSSPLLSRHSVVIIIGTGGKGTGAGTMFPLAQMARQQKKLVIPIFVRPSFERHEVEKRRYDHALGVAERFDAAGIRLMEILNDRGYIGRESRAAVGRLGAHERSDCQRAPRTALRPLGSVAGRSVRPFQPVCGTRQTAHRLLRARSARRPRTGRRSDSSRGSGCWDNPYCAFDGPAGTSLVCIQGDWSNVVDGKIKAQLAALALGQSAESPYNPLYARALRAPRPWGVTTLFAEYTGSHPALDIDWSLEKRIPLRANVPSEIDDVLDEGADAANVASDDGDAAASNAAAPVVADTRVQVTPASVAKVARPSPADPRPLHRFRRSGILRWP